MAEILAPTIPDGDSRLQTTESWIGQVTQAGLDLIRAGGLAAQKALLGIGATTFVSNTPMTVSQLITNYPPDATNAGMYARVTDLYGTVDEVMRCRYDGANYRWVPQREEFYGSSNATTGTLNLVPLVTPPIYDLLGTLTGNMTINVSTTNAYIGQEQVIRSRGLLGIFGITLSGLIGGATLPLLQGNDKTLVYTAAGWRG